MKDDKREVLELFKTLRGGRTCLDAPAVVKALGCDESDARSRLKRLEKSGHLWGPIYSGFHGGVWIERGYTLSRKGRDALSEPD